MAVVEAYHRKYRPKTVDDYIGNTKVKTAVRDMLKNGNRPQVILLQGHSGCGKTTMARLLAKEYCCENRDEEVGACCVCDACKAFDEYIESGETNGLMNLHEIDSGKVGKAEAEGIMAEMEAPSFDGGWKTFIFDECHLLTAGAMGGLLKMVEEPPENVLIVFCTTDPDKMLDTLLSRCQYVLTVEKPTRNELCTLLANICKKEGVAYDEKALSLICTAGDYVPRNTLTNLEGVLRAKGNVQYDSAVAVLNTISDTYYFSFYEMLVEEHVDIYKYIAFLGDLKTKLSLVQFVDGLIAFTKRGIYVYNGVRVEGVDAGEMRQYKKIFTSFRTSEIANILNTLIDIQKSPDVEVRLMLLGYKGIRRIATPVVSDDLKKTLTNPNAQVAKEQKLGTEAHLKEGEVTKEELKDLATTATSNVSMDTLMGMFDVSQFTGNTSEFD